MHSEVPLLLFLALACTGPIDDTGGGSCASLSPATCAADTRCSVIDGAALTWSDDDTCYDAGTSEPLGCYDAAADCDSVVAYAGPGDGTCYQFMSGCLPAGFVDCDPNPNEASECP